MYEAFYIYDLTLLSGEAWWQQGLYVATGDDTTATFDIPGRSTSGHAIYADGNEVDSEDYTINTGGGESNSDRVTFDTAPIRARSSPATSPGSTGCASGSWKINCRANIFFTSCTGTRK